MPGHKLPTLLKFCAAFTALMLLCGSMPVAFAGDTAASSNDKSSPPTAALRPAGIYVSNQDNSLAVFALDATGNAAPLRRIAGPSTGLSLPLGIALDSRGNCMSPIAPARP